MLKNAVFPMFMLALLCALPTDGFSQIDKLKKKADNAKKENATLEQQALDICRQKCGTANTYHKAIITSSDWDVERNSTTGVITGRSMQFAITYTANNGTCYYEDFTFGQDYVGNGYSNALKYISVGFGREIDCNKVK